MRKLDVAISHIVEGTCPGRSSSTVVLRHGSN